MDDLFLSCQEIPTDRLEVVKRYPSGLWFSIKDPSESTMNGVVALTDAQLRILRDHLNAHLSPPISPQD